MRVFVVLLVALAVAQPETHTFQTEVSRLLDIIINSLYSQKEVFLREAISNASDALDKIRFLGVQESRLLDVEPDLSIRISADKENGLLIIEDTGVGMTKADLVNNLGTIARSGTTQFLEALARGSNMNLIGQFGVGFYSYYLVASEVSVHSKHVDDAQYVWRSSAGATFTIELDDGPALKRGTRVVLKLKKEAREFLETRRIRELVTRYSEFISFPIYLHVSKEVEREIEDPQETAKVGETTEEKPPESVEPTPTPEKAEAAQDEAKESISPETQSADKPTEGEIKIRDEEPAPAAKKKIKETVWEWQQLNQSKPLWLRPIEEIKPEEYKEFHRVLVKDAYEDPTTWVHFRGEGEVEFTGLLYVPRRMPHDPYNQEDEKGLKSYMRLYVRRVLVGDDFRELLPRYLSFVQGVVDSDDLPINVSRESLQQLRAIRTIKKKLVRKLLERFERMAKPTTDKKEMTEEERATRNRTRRERYEGFWREYGRSLKLGIIDDSLNRDRIANLLLYRSTFNNTDSLVSLEEYKQRMQPNQTDIYYIGGDNARQLLDAPMVRALARRGYEVLLMDQPIDEYATQILGKFNDLKLTNIAQTGADLAQNDEEKVRGRKLAKLYEKVTTYLRKVLPNVSRVTVNPHISPAPLVVLASMGGYSAHLEKIARAQAVAHSADTPDMFGLSQRYVEINPYHPFLRALLERMEKSEEEQTREAEDTLELAVALYETGLISSGYELREPLKFAARVHRLLATPFGTAPGVESVEIDVDALPDPETKVESGAEASAASESPLDASIDDLLKTAGNATEAAPEIITLPTSEEAALFNEL